MKHRIWKEEYIQFLKDNYKYTPNRKLAAMLNAEFGTKFDRYQVQRIKYLYGLRSGLKRNLERAR